MGGTANSLSLHLPPSVPTENSLWVGFCSQALQTKLLVPRGQETLSVLSRPLPHPSVNTRGKSIWSLEGLHKEHALENTSVSWMPYARPSCSGRLTLGPLLHQSFPTRPPRMDASGSGEPAFLLPWSLSAAQDNEENAELCSHSFQERCTVTNRAVPSSHKHSGVG